jgi:hypothetical protein
MAFGVIVAAIVALSVRAIAIGKPHRSEAGAAKPSTRPTRPSPSNWTPWPYCAATASEWWCHAPAATSVVRLSAADVSGGALTIQGAHADVAARDVCANLAHANVLIGIYFDAGASADDAGSVTGYDAVRPFAADNLKLATLVQTDVLAAMNAQDWAIPDDGVISDVNLGGPALSGAAASYGHLLLRGPAQAGYFSTPSQMPGALIEPLFITDPFEGSIAASAASQQVIAAGLAQAVEQYFGPPTSTNG